MKSIGIITIHKINNYGSVLQAYALQRVCQEMGYRVEIIDYQFPNAFHSANPYVTQDSFPTEPRWIKALFTSALIRQHKGIRTFVNARHNLSQKTYYSPEEVASDAPKYDIYITGSDQLWNPRYCNGDPTFMLHFAPDNALKIAYAASIGTDTIPCELIQCYRKLLGRYSALSVREKSGKTIVEAISDKPTSVVLDPSLLLNRDEWNKIASPRRQVKKKYILCYFLNYSFNAYPYVDILADHMQSLTGYEIVRVARPPHKLSWNHTSYHVGASPEEFLALVRDAEMVLTTSFHGTAFAVNFGRPLLSVIKSHDSGDSRQKSLLQSLGMDAQILSIEDPMPDASRAVYDVATEQAKLTALRHESLSYLQKALTNE